MSPALAQLDAALLHLALDNLADSVTIHDARGKLLYVNEATAGLMGGQSVEDILAADPGAWTERFAMYHENGRPVDLGELPGRRVFRGDAPDPLLVRRIDKQDGRSRWIRIKAAPLLDNEGNVKAAANVSEDVTDVKEAELAQRLLADAGAALAASLDYETTLQQVAQLAVPELADWCGVDLLGPRGDIEPVAIAHAEPEKVALGLELRERYPTDPQTEGGVGAVLRSGEAELIEDIPDEMLVAAARDEDHLRLLRAIGLRSVLIVPLSFGQRVIGTMSFVLAEQDRRFSDAEIGLAHELARRAVLAIENARLYTERSRIAKTLQEGLLPPTLEAPPGWETAVLFRAAGTANEVGGDFYDVVRVDSGWIGFVGDVTGKGAAAAAITARARYTMISVAQLTGEATEALERVNLALVELGGLPFCTVACAQFRGDPGQGRVDITSAGHPLPLIVRDGEVERVGESGPLLGFDPEAGWRSKPVRVEPGDAIVLFSDGVTDTIGPGRERFGEKRLMEVLGSGPVTSAAELVDRLDSRLLEFQDSEQRDDIAVLVLRRQR
ncbi:MAG: SpoIIE family protein phosphatase [Thermoleophilaceae bacterium]